MRAPFDIERTTRRSPPNLPNMHVGVLEFFLYLRVDFLLHNLSVAHRYCKHVGFIIVMASPPHCESPSIRMPVYGPNGSELFFEIHENLLRSAALRRYQVILRQI